MPSHSEGPGIWLSVWRFFLTHCLYERAAKVLARLRGCAGSPEPSLLAYVISTKFAWRGPYGKIVNGKVLGVPQSQAAGNYRHQEKEKKDKHQRVQNKQRQDKHMNQLSLAQVNWGLWRVYVISAFYGFLVFLMQRCVASGLFWGIVHTK